MSSWLIVGVIVAGFVWIAFWVKLPNSIPSTEKAREEIEVEKEGPKNIGEPVLTLVRLYKENPERFKGLGVLDKNQTQGLLFNSLYFKFILKDLETGVAYRFKAYKDTFPPYNTHTNLFFSQYYGENWLTPDEQEYVNKELQPYIKSAIEGILYNNVNMIGKKFYEQTNRREELVKTYCEEKV